MKLIDKYLPADYSDSVSIPGYLGGIEGTYHTPKGYYVAFENKEAFELYEATFPAKEKKVLEGQL